MYNMMLSTASESVLRTKACKERLKNNTSAKINFSKLDLILNLPIRLFPLPECVAGPVPETQCCSEGPGAALQPPGLQGGGGLGQTLPVPGARGPLRPLPAREQGRLIHSNSEIMSEVQLSYAIKTHSLSSVFMA